MAHESDEETNIWEEILNGTRGQGQARSLIDRSLVLLGDEGCGKSHLVARLKQVSSDELSRCLAMDSTFVEVMQEEDDELVLVGRLNIWQLAGDEHYSPLLKIAASAPASTMFGICLNYATPWTMGAALAKWLGVIEETMAAAQLETAQVAEMKERLVLAFRSYKEPSKDLSGNDTAAPVATAEGTAASDAAAGLLPLTEGALRKNLGVPIVVICTMTDQLESLQSQFAYKDAHFDYIQGALRKTCLEYGAGLFYTSARDAINTDALMGYIRWALYGHRQFAPPEVLEKERVLIPAGWDTLSKIAGLEDSSRVLLKGKTGTDGSEPAFGDVIRAPLHLSNPSAKAADALVTAEDDQEFLSRFKDLAESQESEAPAGGDAVAKGLSDLLSAGKKRSGTATSGPAGSAAAGVATGAPSVLQSLGVQPAAAGAGAAPGAAPPKEEALSSFFAALLNKQTPASAAAPDAKP